MTAFESTASLGSPASARTGEPRSLAILAAAGALIALYGIVYFRAGQVMPLDDAYITLHNAEVLFSGRDASFGVSALTGATSLVHLAMTAALWPLARGATPALLCLAGAVVYLLGIARLARLSGLSAGAELLLLGLAVTSGSIPYHLFNGLETSWALAGATWAIVLARRSAPDFRLPALLGVLPFLRPELGVLSLALLGRQTFLRLGAPGAGAGIASDLAVAGLSAAPWALWSAVATGGLTPNTAAAKAAFFAEPAAPWALAIASVGVAVLKGLGPLPLALPLAPRSTLKAALVAAALALLAGSAARFPGLLFHNHGRYTMALAPIGLWALASLYASRRQRFWAFGGALALTSPFWLWSSLTAMAVDQGQTRDAFAAVAWAERELPAGEPMLIHDAGVAGLLSTRPLVDVVGLKTPGSAEAHLLWTLPSQGRQRGHALAEIAGAAHARYAMILQDEPRFWANIGSDLERGGWRLEPLREPGARPGYAIFRLTPPG
jgi:hypothetical protein